MTKPIKSFADTVKKGDLYSQLDAEQKLFREYGESYYETNDESVRKDLTECFHAENKKIREKFQGLQ